MLLDCAGRSCKPGRDRTTRAAVVGVAKEVLTPPPARPHSRQTTSEAFWAAQTTATLRIDSIESSSRDARTPGRVQSLALGTRRARPSSPTICLHGWGREGHQLAERLAGRQLPYSRTLRLLPNTPGTVLLDAPGTWRGSSRAAYFNPFFTQAELDVRRDRCRGRKR